MRAATPDDPPGRPPDGWLTLTEAAARTGHTREAIRQRVRRGSLRAVKGNDGVLRLDTRDLADMPPPDATAADQEADQGDAGSASTVATLADLVATVADLRTTADTTRMALDKSHTDHLADRGRAERAEAQVEAEAARVTVAEAREAEARACADQLERERDQARQEREDARIRAASAEGEARALREALEEARRPTWRRWLGVR